MRFHRTTHFSKSWTPEQEKEYLKEYYRKNTTLLNERSKQRYEDNKEMLNKEHIAYQQKNRLKKNEINKRCHRKTKIICIAHYSNNTFKCAYCGFSNITALTIDHVNGGGRKHRRQVGDIYRWLIKNNFPSGFQVLCMNCQFIKQHNRKENYKQKSEVESLIVFLDKK